MKTIHLVLVFAATLVGVWPAKSADTNSIAGVYILETVNGEKLSAAVTHEGNALKIRSGAFTINADGTCSSKITVLPPSGEETTVVVKARSVRAMNVFERVMADFPISVDPNRATAMPVLNRR